MCVASNDDDGRESRLCDARFGPCVCLFSVYCTHIKEQLARSDDLTAPDDECAKQRVDIKAITINAAIHTIRACKSSRASAYVSPMFDHRFYFILFHDYIFPCQSSLVRFPLFIVFHLYSNDEIDALN